MPACEWCGDPYIPATRPGGRKQRFCSERCGDDWENAQRRASRRRPSERLPVWPEVFEMPDGHFFEDGLCTMPPYAGHFWWTSDEPAEREMAKRICRACPVRLLCAEWGLHVSFKDSTGIYGGMSAIERRKARTAALAQERAAS